MVDTFKNMTQEEFTATDYYLIRHYAKKCDLESYLELHDLNINQVVLQLDHYLKAYYKEKYSFIDLEEDEEE